MVYKFYAKNFNDLFLKFKLKNIKRPLDKKEHGNEIYSNRL